MPIELLGIQMMANIVRLARFDEHIEKLKPNWRRHRQRHQILDLLELYSGQFLQLQLQE